MNEKYTRIGCASLCLDLGDPDPIESTCLPEKLSTPISHGACLSAPCPMSSIFRLTWHISLHRVPTPSSRARPRSRLIARINNCNSIYIPVSLKSPELRLTRVRCTENSIAKPNWCGRFTNGQPIDTLRQI